MFLDLLIRRNPAFIEAAMALHQQGAIPANCYVLDLDTVEHNVRMFQQEARKFNLTTFAMTKQVGRHSGFCQAVMRGGIDRSVAVDMACAVACNRAGLKTGHLGHLVQIPARETGCAATRLQPDFWTVFSETKAREAAAASRACGREQPLLARIQAPEDTFYRGHEGGFAAADILATADCLDGLDGARFAGITSFPALLFDPATRTVAPTPNLATLHKAADILAANGYAGMAVNAPGTTSSVVLHALAEAGTTQCEPGNGLHGTTPLHAVEELPEDPAILYLTEVSHRHGGKAYCFGGGLYIDPVFPDYQVQALVSATPTASQSALHDVEIPVPAAIDYYGMIDATSPRRPEPGESVVFGFRGQAFVTRAHVAGLRGVATGEPRVTTIENGFGDPTGWPWTDHA